MLKTLYNILNIPFVAILKRRGNYSKWIELNEPSQGNLEMQRRLSRLMTVRPTISVVVNLCGPFDEDKLNNLIESIKGQTYENWEIFFILNENVDDGFVSETMGPGKSIFFIKSSGGSLHNIDVFKRLKGEFIAILNDNLLLSPFCFYEIIITQRQYPGVDFIYGDSDFIGENGKRHGVQFKPGLSIDTLRSYNYIGGFVVLGRGLFFALLSVFKGKVDYRFLLAGVLNSNKGERVPKVLYHERQEKTIGNFDQYKERDNNAVSVLKDHLGRAGLHGDVSVVGAGRYRVSYNLSSTPLVSIIIPNRDCSALLKRCVESIMEKSGYKELEIIIVENGSTDPDTFKLYDSFNKSFSCVKIEEFFIEGKFNFSNINNYAAGLAKGSVLLFLNNDTEMLAEAHSTLSQGSIKEMLGLAMRADVGAVGSMLYYPDGTLQHGGVVIGLHGIAGHPGRGLKKLDSALRFSVVRNVSAVTGACLMVRKELFMKAGGFDANLALSYNDIDLCLKLLQLGYKNIWTPFSQFIHYESKTRGYDRFGRNRRRLNNESKYFTEKWQDFIKGGDPYYNPNLMKTGEDVSLYRGGKV